VFHDHYGACVGLNENHPKERNRWNCAHEYGHYLVNRYLPDIVNAEKNDFKMERVVDEFAKNFLMPSEGINASFDLLITQNAGKITPVELLVLAARCGVSFQAIVSRLEELGRLRTGTYETLRLNKFRMQETRMRYGIHAVEDEFARYSRRYRILLLKSLADGKISEGEAARLVGKDRMGVRQLVDNTLKQLGLDEIDDINLDLAERVN